MPGVGEQEFFGASILDGSGSLVTTGTATIQFLIEDSGTTKYLQDDLTTMSATPNTIDAPHDSDYKAHGVNLTFPESMRGFPVTWTLFDFSSDGSYSGKFEVSAGPEGGGNISVVVE